MTIWQAFRDGLGRVNAAPAVLLGGMVVTLALALPLTLSLGTMIQADLGDSLDAGRVADGVDMAWWQEFTDRATGVGTTFKPSIIGFAAVLRNLSGVVDAERLSMPIAGAVAVSLGVWAFLVGGILDRYARARPTRAHGFFSACGTYFFRFVRLGLAAGLIYIVLFRVLHGWIFDRLEPFVTREFTAERSAFAVRLALYMVFGAIVIGVNLVIDYAKVRAVVEDRRSMVGAVLAGLRFARRRPLKTAGLYLMNGALFVAIVALYASLAPWVGHSGGAYWMSFALGQAYIFGRVWAKLVFYATQTAFFQGELAHAGYVATPLPVWPDSPAADSLGSTRDPG